MKVRSIEEQDRGDGLTGYSPKFERPDHLERIRTDHETARPEPEPDPADDRHHDQAGNESFPQAEGNTHQPENGQQQEPQRQGPNQGRHGRQAKGLPRRGHCRAFLDLMLSRMVPTSARCRSARAAILVHTTHGNRLPILVHRKDAKDAERGKGFY